MGGAVGEGAELLVFPEYGAMELTSRPALALVLLQAVEAGTFDRKHLTALHARQLRSLGLLVHLVRYDEPVRPHDYDLVVLGPGPGDPNADDDPRVAALRRLVRRLLDEERPLLAVCLSHQVLSRELGLAVRRRSTPNQGVRRTVDLFGEPVDVGFYNSFAAHSPHDVHEAPGGVRVEVSRDAGGEVHALRGPGFRSVQFHAESVISRDGLDVLRGLVRDLLARRSVVVR